MRWGSKWCQMHHSHRRTARRCITIKKWEEKVREYIHVKFPTNPHFFFLIFAQKYSLDCIHPKVILWQPQCRDVVFAHATGSEEERDGFIGYHPDALNQVIDPLVQ